MVSLVDTPLVNGISPCEGPPGTKVKIWGENLGIGASDVVSIKICGHECVDWFEWASERKIICKTGYGRGRGKIIVSTLSAGVGTCTVYFTGTDPPTTEEPALDALQESSMWVEEEWNMFQGFDSHDPRPAQAIVESHEDPLKLGIGFKSAPRRLSDENIKQLCPTGRGDLLAENFNPVMFLLDKHCASSFVELQRGLENLRREVAKSEQAPAQFIRDNLDAFIQCYDTLSDVNALLIKNESESEGGSITDKVETSLKESYNMAERLFQGVLNRKVKADASRNALAVLQRYRFLFNLPRSIEKNIRNKEYEIVTNDYERAKSLFAGTKVKVFSKVLEEVENLVRKLRADLRNQLLCNPSTLEQQRKIIKYLLDLDYSGDPAWECIIEMHQWMVRLLLDCKQEFQDTSETSCSDSSQRSVGHKRSSSNHSQGSSGSGGYVPSISVRGLGGGRALGVIAEVEKRTEHSKPARVEFIERLTEIFSNSLPNHYRLGQAHFNRTLFTNATEQQSSVIYVNFADKKAQFDEMVEEVAEVFTDMVNAALFQDALEGIPPERVARLGTWKPFDDVLAETSGAWLPSCVRQIRACLSNLQTLHLPESPLSLVQQLSANVRILCMETLFIRTTKDIEVLHLREDWRVQAEEGSVITSLPVLFESIVVELLLTLREIVIEIHPGETEEHRGQLTRAAVGFFQGILEDYVCCLKRLVFPDDDDVDGEAGESSAKSKSKECVASTTSEDLLNKPSRDEMLLIVLSNSSYTQNFVAARIFDCFVNYGYPECKDVEKEFLDRLAELDCAVFDEYIKLKLVPLLMLIEPGMNGGYFDWETHVLPNGIRSYVMEILLSLVYVHAEVYAISSHMVKKVLRKLLEKVVSELLEQLEKIPSFSPEGSLHAYIELKALHDVLILYSSDSSNESFQSAYKKLNVDTYEPLRVRDIFADFEKRTALQFKCFQNPDLSDIV